MNIISNNDVSILVPSKVEPEIRIRVHIVHWKDKTNIGKAWGSVIEQKDGQPIKGTLSSTTNQ